MKFLIAYECRTGGISSVGEFEFEAEQEPEITNSLVLEAAFRESIQLRSSGQGGLSIISISPITH
jgi:hypothetical protein